MSQNMTLDEIQNTVTEEKKKEENTEILFSDDDEDDELVNLRLRRESLQRR